MVDHPALVTQVEQYPPVAVAVFVALKTVPDRLFELGMFIRCGESFLVVEECRACHAGRIQEVVQAVV